MNGEMFGKTAKFHARLPLTLAGGRKSTMTDSQYIWGAAGSKLQQSHALDP